MDFGCAYAPQAYYFRKHKKYIGIDVSGCKKFKFENTEFWINDMDEEIKCDEVSNLDPNTTFAICSYVPASTEKIRAKFKNCFIYYPAS